MNDIYMSNNTWIIHICTLHTYDRWVIYVIYLYKNNNNILNCYMLEFKIFYYFKNIQR